MAIYSMTIVFWKETTFPLWRAMERRWKRIAVSLVSSLIVLMCLPIIIIVCYRFLVHTHTHIRLTALFPGLPRWAGTRKVEPIWILLKQETVSGSSISGARCKSAPCSRHITTPASHHSVFYRPDALPAAQPTASKHWRHNFQCIYYNMKISALQP